LKSLVEFSRAGSPGWQGFNTRESRILRRTKMPPGNKTGGRLSANRPESLGFYPKCGAMTRRLYACATNFLLV
jgi:hypothetical protein